MAEYPWFQTTGTAYRLTQVAQSMGSMPNPLPAMEGDKKLAGMLNLLYPPVEDGRMRNAAAIITMPGESVDVTGLACRW